MHSIYCVWLACSMGLGHSLSCPGFTSDQSLLMIDRWTAQLILWLPEIIHTYIDGDYQQQIINLYVSHADVCM